MIVMYCLAVIGVMVLSGTVLFLSGLSCKPPTSSVLILVGVLLVVSGLFFGMVLALWEELNGSQKTLT